MSISAAMSNAVLGLRAAGRGAEVISSNISNALTPGYGRRALDLSSAALGGVRIDGITRHVDAGVASDRRLAHAANSNASSTSDFLAKLEGLLGTPNDASSIAGRLAGFESALITAASRPDAPDRLMGAIDEANSLLTGLRAATQGVQDARTQADRTIAAQVQELNASLGHVQFLNGAITEALARNGDASSLLDQRQQVVDRIGELVPLREIARPQGQIALYSTSGASLIDGRAATIGFESSNVVTPYQSEAAGTLSGLTINDLPARTGSTNGALRGGAIAAQFAIRDELGIAAQTEIDALARDLVERFQDPTLDTTLGAGDAGLFTDEGGAFDPLNELGLAERLEINAAVDPSKGGEVWRLRDGINAATEGPVGDATLLNALSAALSGAHTTASGAQAGSTLTASGLVSAMISGFGVERNAADQKMSFTAAQLEELTQQQLADGVDSDAELQRLLVVEQTYAANAKLIETLDELMQLITRL